MATPVASSAGAVGPSPNGDAERLGRRDLLVLRMELRRRRRAAAGAVAGGSASGQRATRNTR